MLLDHIQLGNHGSNLTEEELETHSISAWKEGKLNLMRQIDGNLRPYRRRLVHVRKILYDLITAWATS